MSWPTPKDFSAAVRKPDAAFADPELAAADAVLGPDGWPLPHPGDSSVVYQLCAEDDRAWAVKCFARPDPARGARYARVREVLDWAAVRSAVGFTFLEAGVRIGDQPYPALKMDWVEGTPLNRAVRDRAGDPAALDALFRQWVGLCRELRAAGVAHGDLQHGNVLLAADTIKLVDYDGMYVPALANSPPGEFGHPNYQHPARAAGRVYSSDVDRFPHLVVATALKALAVLGPTLWRRYDTGDNLLFTAADFRSPAASPLMCELWQSSHLELRALVGHLVLACGRPIPETPWLDDLAPEGAEVLLTIEEEQAAAAALAAAPAVEPPVAHAVPATPEEVLPLDDEPESVPAPPRRAVSARGPGRAAPRPRVDQEPELPPAWTVLLKPAAVIAGVLLIIGGTITGVVLALLPDSKEETTQVQPEEPQPPAPKPNPKPEPVPTPPAPAPGIAPAVPVPATNPPAFAPPRVVPAPAVPAQPTFTRVWAKPVGDGRGFVRVYFGQDGRSVFVFDAGKLDSFDARTGEPRASFRGPGAPTSPLGVRTLDGDRVAVLGHPLKAPSLWDAKTGNPLPNLLAQDPLPPPPAGVLPTAIECQVSPDGRYVFAGYQGPFRGQFYGPAPYRVVEVATGKVVASGEWQYGAARFTDDGSRLLTAETGGRVRWMKTATGESELEWAFQPNSFPRMIAGMSADGSLVNYHGRPPGMANGQYLLDGKTGQVLRKLDFGFNGDRSVLTPDGKWLAGVVNEPPDFRRFAAVIADARTGHVLVRTPMDGDLNDYQQVSFTPDGKSFALFHRSKREVAVYELRGDVPPLPPGTPVPAPLGPVPERAQPGAVAVAPVPPGPPPFPPPPANGLPPAPPLMPRWTVATEAGIMANQLPQAPLYTRDGKTIVLAGGSNGTIHTFDAKTGAAGAAYAGHKGPGGVRWLQLIGGDRVVSGGFDGKQATWDIKTARRLDEEVKFPELPPMPAGLAGHAGITHAVSPTGRYTVLARKESARPTVPGPLRVLDTTTGKEVVKADWNGGHIAFTADEARVFVLDGLGKATWYKLPSGEIDVQWQAGQGQEAEFARINAVTADGKLILFRGPVQGRPAGVYLLDGRTGQVIRQLPAVVPYQAAFSSLSPDGRFVVVMATDFRGGVTWYADLFEAATWRLVGRVAPPEKGAKGPAEVGFSPDGKEMGIFYPQAKEMSVFTLPDGAAQVVVPPAPVPVPMPPAAVVPALRPRWVAPAGVGREAVPVRFEPDGGRLILGNPAEQKVAVFSVKGGPSPDRLEGMRWNGPGDLFVLGGGRLGFHYRTDPSVSVWDLKAGKAADPIPVPDIPPGPDRRNSRSVWLSADAKYIAAARGPTPQTAAPLRVFETGAAKAAVAIDWRGGSVFFTADPPRVLVAESDGRCRWFKLPSGEPDGEFALPKPEGGVSPRVTDITADGKLAGYVGPGIGAERAAAAVLDAKTGAVARSFGPEYAAAHVSLSADGKLAAALRKPGPGSDWFSVDVVEAAGGRVVGRAALPGGRITPTFLLTPDGRSLAVHDYGQDRVSWFELGGNPGEIAPKPNPPEPPAIGRAGELAPRWVATPECGDTIASFRYEPDAGLILLSNAFTKLNAAVDARTGKSVPERVEGLRLVPGGDLFPMANGRVGIFNMKEASIAVWDLKAGRAGEAIPIPDIPEGPETQNFRYARLSPDGKFLAVGRRGTGPQADPVPLQVFDAATRKTLLATNWRGGSVFFTADSSRVLIADAGGRCRWFKLPSFEPDGDWDVGRPGVAREQSFTSISADGGRVGYYGTGAGPDRASVAVLNGKSGEVVRAFGAEYFYTSPVSLSGDGKLAAVMRKPPGFGSEFTVDVVGVDDGRLVGRATVTTRNRSVPQFQVTPDGRALLIHDYNGKKLYWYDLPEGGK